MHYLQILCILYRLVGYQYLLRIIVVVKQSLVRHPHKYFLKGERLPIQSSSINELQYTEILNQIKILSRVLEILEISIASFMLIGEL